MDLQHRADEATRFKPGANHPKYLGDKPAAPTGKRFGEWEVVSRYAFRRKGHLYVAALCHACGKGDLVALRNLIKGKSTRCKRCAAKKHWDSRNEGIWGRSLDAFDITLSERWSAMMRRCFDPACRGYQNYGGRGIIVEPPLTNRVEFVNYVRGLPNASPGLEVDRTDNNGNYALGNLRFVTRKENTNNTRRSVRVSYQGRRLTVADFVGETGCAYRKSVVHRLMREGLTGEQILERAKGNHLVGRRWERRPKTNTEDQQTITNGINK